MNLYTRRVQRLRNELNEAGCDGCALLPGANFAYYTGQFKFVDLLTTVLYIPAAGVTNVDRPVLLVTGFEEYTTVSAMPYPVDAIPYERDTDGYAEGFSQFADKLGLDRACVGVESTGMRFLEAQMLQSAAPDLKLQAIDTILSGIRAIKSANEIESIRQAAQITERGLDAVFEQIEAGMTEIELRNRFHIELLRAGAEGTGFDSIVVSGPRGALQHATSSDRVIQSGDAILLDVGARYRGYTADITRMVVLGPVSDEFRVIYEIVREANAAAQAAVHPGRTAHEVDRAARDVIERAGYVETFVHGTGHGLGLDVHEPPRIAPGDHAVLKPGMVFTIEPGIYLRGRFGARIEDDITVTEDGYDRLTSFSHDLVIL